MSAPSIYLGPAFALDATRGQAAAAAAELAPRMQRKRAVLIGASDAHLCSLLTDVLRDMRDYHLDVEILDQETGEPDVMLALVDRADGVRAISDARERFPRTPVVAILTLGTHRLGTRAVAAGAQACYLLDMPIDRLRGLITALLKAPPPLAPIKKLARPRQLDPR